MRDTVLVIDDDPYLRDLIEMTGEILGVRVLKAKNCCDGLDVLESEISRIKIVLLDYFMPGMTASDCVGKLRDRVQSQIPIVLVTAAADPAERAQELQLEKWIAKPFDYELLKKLIRD